MALSIFDYYNMPAVPARQAYPPVSYGYFSTNIASGATTYVKEGPPTELPFSNEWIAGVNRSFDIFVGGNIINRATIVVSASINGVFYGLYDNIAVSNVGSQMRAVVTNYVIPCWTVMFQVHNPTAAIGTFSVLIAARGR